MTHLDSVHSGRVARAAFLLVPLLLVPLLLVASWASPASAGRPRTREAESWEAKADYTGSQACIDCHLAMAGVVACTP